MKALLVLYFIAAVFWALAQINRERPTYGPVVGVLSALVYTGFVVLIVAFV